MSKKPSDTPANPSAPTGASPAQGGGKQSPDSAGERSASPRVGPKPERPTETEPRVSHPVHHHDHPVALDRSTDASGSPRATVEDDEPTFERTPVGGAIEPDDFDLPESTYSDMADDRGTRRRLTPVRKVNVAEIDPIVLEGVKAVRADYDDDVDDIEKALSQEYYAVAEAVTERLNRRQLPPVTRLLLSQRSVYLALLAREIGKIAASRDNGADSEHSAHTHRLGRAHDREVATAALT